MNTAEAQCPVRRNKKKKKKVVLMPLSITACVHHVAHAGKQKNTSDTNGNDKERQCPLSWSRFPALNMLNCLLGISIQWESTKGPDFIAPGKVKRVPSRLIHTTLEAAYNLLP